MTPAKPTDTQEKLLREIRNELEEGGYACALQLLADSEARAVEANNKMRDKELREWLDKKNKLEKDIARHISGYKIRGMQDEQSLTVLRERVRVLEEALKQVESWTGFPETGVFWDPPHFREPMSYGACYGSSGERDFMRGIARAALATPANPPAANDAKEGGK